MSSPVGYLVTAPNSGDSSTAPIKSSLRKLPYNSLSASNYSQAGGHFIPAFLSSQTDFQPTTETSSGRVLCYERRSVGQSVLE
jgi:hypothetical protein